MAVYYKGTTDRLRPGLLIQDRLCANKERTEEPLHPPTKIMAPCYEVARRGVPKSKNIISTPQTLPILGTPEMQTTHKTQTNKEQDKQKRENKMQAIDTLKCACKNNHSVAIS